MKHNVNMLLMLFLLLSLSCNMVFIYLMDEQLSLVTSKQEALNMEYAGNISDCFQDRDTYHTRLLEVSHNCMSYVLLRENTTYETTRLWAFNYLNNLTVENMLYRHRLTECNLKVKNLKDNVCN